MPSTRSAWSTTATAGILIIATLMASSFWFWLGIGLAAGSNSPETTVDTVFGTVVTESYVSTGRVWFAIAFSLVMTVVTWAIAKAIAEGE